MVNVIDSTLLQNQGDEVAILDLNSMQPMSIESKKDEIKQALLSLINSETARLVIQGSNVTETHAQFLLNLLKEDELALFVAEVNFPEALENSKIQIECDNLISNHRLEKNAPHHSTGTPAAQKATQETPKGRIRAKKVKPKIEITLYEEATDTPKEKENPTIKIKTPPAKIVEPAKLTRTPMAERIINDILSQEGYQTEKDLWERLTNRQEAQEFRTNFPQRRPVKREDHPLQYLIRNHPELKNKLNQWTQTLSLKIEHYDALLDVCGQYGTTGLEQLFKIWEYDNDPYKTAAFNETHALLLKHMSSYLPFISNPAINETISKIANLSVEKRSWWVALIKNHVEFTKGYSDLPYLFKVFTEATVVIEEMGLPFYTTNTIKNKGSLPSTLTNMMALLQKCPSQDKETQWKCINAVSIPEHSNVHFMIPEMKSEEPHPTLQEMNAKIDSSPESDPLSIKPVFYRYIAQQKHHLPLKKYEHILNDIYSNTVLTNQNKLRMIFVLAKTTSSNDAIGFDAESIYKEWTAFQVRTTDLEYMERIKANRTGLARLALTNGLEMEGGYPEVRNKLLKPIMSMAATPPMSYLNKLLTLSEYKFLNPNLSLLDMKSVQKEMLVKTDEAATLYVEHPESMLKAIRFCKTETIKPNSKGQFIPEPTDITLLEQFVITSKLFIDKKHNTLSKAEHNPSHVLLPLLTTFHLEYESNDNLEQLIARYKDRMAGTKKPELKENIQNLLPYGLSLLQLIKSRSHPRTLNLQILDTIQNELLDLIGTSSSVSKKQVREWLHQHYGAYFEGNVLLDMKDDVNFDALFDTLECQDPGIRRAIEALASQFDEEDEKGYHAELATDLVKLTKTLTPEQSARLFTSFTSALKTDGILSRKKQDVPPAYIQQFRTLIQTLASSRAIAELEQYLIIAKEHVLQKGTEKNHLQKCTYLIKTLYPALMAKGVERKEAFNFAAKLVCQSPLQATLVSHGQLNFAPDIRLNSNELNELEEAVKQFDNGKTVDRLKAISQKMAAIIALDPDNIDYFIACKKSKVLVDRILSQVDQRTTAHQNQNAFMKAWSAIKNLGAYYPTISPEELLSLHNENLSSLVANTQNDVKNVILKSNTRFQDLVTHLYDRKGALIEKYGNIAIRADNFITKALSLSPNDVSKNHNEISQLIDNLILLNDQNLVLSLMYHYAGGMPGRDIQDLVELLNAPHYQALNSTLKRNFINVIMSQMNNNVSCNKKEVNHFLAYLFENKEKTLVTDCIHDFYQQAPYPPLEKLIHWTKNLGSRAALNAAYEHFDKNPCALTNGHDGREKENGFKLAQAKSQLAKMPELKGIFTQDYLKQVEEQSNLVKMLSTRDILQRLKSYKNIPHENHIELVTLTAELMHRCKGRPPQFFGGVQIPGRSFELNTTQIMGSLGILETGRRVTAEIGTGEGKTRILMMINACQFIKGNTVDFLTSNLALAERDYLESLPFFKSLGAEVNFITASSQIEDYKIGGINVSDPANLFLFRKKAALQKKSALVIDPDKEKRTLTLDEADVTFFDVSNTKYVFSSHTPQVNKELIPLYPLLMEFFAQSESEKTYMENKKRCNAQLLDFIEARNPELFNIVKTFKVEQLEKLQDAAYMARHLDYNVDYSIVSEATIPTELGNQKVAAARCLIASRINENARFSEGVHACLQAELNRLMTVADSEISNPYLKEILEKCKTKDRHFDIEPQRQIATATSANTMLKDYSLGNLMAVTGTAGTDLEKREAKASFKTEFIYVPRHKGLHRYDHPIIVCKNDNHYVDTFVTSILEARAKKQPTLIICKDDNQSRQLHDALQNRLASLKDKNGLPKITRVHAATDYEDGFSEAAYIKNEAGKAGYVTISTEMEARGVDIIPDPAGLRLLPAFLLKDERDYIQAVGRSGRFGQIGTSQMILNIESLKEDFGIDYLNTDFYLNSEAFIKRLQIFSTITKKLHRLFYRGFDDLLGSYTQKYEQLRLDDPESAKSWSDFLEQINLSQENAQQAIEAQIQLKKPNINEMEAKLVEHSAKAAELWTTFLESLPEAQKTIDTPVPELKKPKELDLWIQSMKGLQEKGIETVEVTEKRKVRVHEHYSAATAGRVHLLKYPATFSPNFIAWWKGEGLLFPNVQHWWHGELGLRDLLFGFLRNANAWWNNEGLLFPNERAWLSGNLSFRNMVSQWPIFRYFIKAVEETHEVKIVIPSTYAFFYKKYPEIIEDDSDLENEDALDPVNHDPLFAPDDEEVVNEAPSNHQNNNTLS